MPFDSLPVKAPTKEQETVDKAINLIEKGWCQGSSARNVQDRPTDVLSSTAIRFCALGALYRTGKSTCYPVLRRNLSSIVNDAVSNWNDTPGRTKEEVIEALKKLRELV